MIFVLRTHGNHVLGEDGTWANVGTHVGQSFERVSKCGLMVVLCLDGGGRFRLCSVAVIVATYILLVFADTVGVRVGCCPCAAHQAWWLTGGISVGHSRSYVGAQESKLWLCSKNTLSCQIT